MVEWLYSLGLGWRQLVELAILAVMYYYLLLFLRGTRGAQVLMGMVISLASLFALSYFLRLYTLNWLLQQLSVFLPRGLHRHSSNPKSDGPSPSSVRSPCSRRRSVDAAWSIPWSKPCSPCPAARSAP